VKAIQYSEVAPVFFDNGEAKRVAIRVVIGKADGAANSCMRVFEIREGGYTPRHSHSWEHQMFFHAGQGEVFCDGRWHAVKTGSAVLVPGNLEHQIRNSGTEALVIVCLLPSSAPEL
jgi:quercetin dioxygenase-like cupin family protein